MWHVWARVGSPCRAAGRNRCLQRLVAHGLLPCSPSPCTPAHAVCHTEKRLLAQHAAAIASQFPAGSVVVELGCGDCTKTALLLQALVDRWDSSWLVDAVRLASSHWWSLCAIWPEKVLLGHFCLQSGMLGAASDPADPTQCRSRQNMHILAAAAAQARPHRHPLLRRGLLRRGAAPNRAQPGAPGAWPAAGAGEGPAEAGVQLCEQDGDCGWEVQGGVRGRAAQGKGKGPSPHTAASNASAAAHPCTPFKPNRWS